jgi:hypothetical protein
LEFDENRGELERIARELAALLNAVVTIVADVELELEPRLQRKT